MVHVQACLSAREDRESGFHPCGGPMGSCKPVFFLREGLDNAVLTSEEVLGSTRRPV